MTTPTERSRDWRLAHPEEAREHRRRGRDNHWFGGMREIVLERDNYQCVRCGMTDEEHRKRWNRSITVDHIDGKGRHVPKDQQNNDPTNLQTLCLSCHGLKDSWQYWKGFDPGRAKAELLTKEKV